MDKDLIIQTLKSISLQAQSLAQLISGGAEPTLEDKRLALLQERDRLNVQMSNCRSGETVRALKEHQNNILAQIADIDFKLKNA